MLDTDPLILASGSTTRARMLRGAGVPIEIAVPAIDEPELMASLNSAGATAARVAEVLAEMKAQRIAPRFPGRFVLGCDQMLECDGLWLDKPADRDDARKQLKMPARQEPQPHHQRGAGARRSAHLAPHRPRRAAHAGFQRRVPRRLSRRRRARTCCARSAPISSKGSARNCSTG